VRIDRRQLLGGLVALAGCTPAPPARQDGVFAAGQPAALLILALAPERLLGWPRRPSRQALQLLPPGADLPELGALASGGAPADLEGVAALRPTLLLDYGDTDAAYAALAARVQARLGVPYRLIDGALANTPQALREVGAALGVAARGDALAAAAARILARWSTHRVDGPGFYYARGADGLETGFRGALAGEVMEGAGWTNVATGGHDIGRVAREQIAAWDPEVIVTLDRAFADAAANASFWRQRRGGGRRRLLLLPDLPFGWIDRPPSLNRLLGCLAFAGGALLARDPGAVAAPARAFQRLFFGIALNETQSATLVPRWIA